MLPAPPSMRKESQSMFVHGLGTAHPERRYTKAECWDAFQTSPWFEQLDRRSRAIAQTVLLGDNGIEARRLAVSSLADVFEIDPDTLHARFLEHAPQARGRSRGEGAARGGPRDGRGRGYRREHVHGLSLPRACRATSSSGSACRATCARSTSSATAARRRCRIGNSPTRCSSRGGAATSSRSASSSAARRCISTTTPAC